MDLLTLACVFALCSCKSVLAPGGLVHVTLAGDQESRWRLTPTAVRLGYTLHHKCDFYLQFGRTMTPLEVKRHQSGRSFRIRDLPSFTYSYALGGRGEEKVVSVPWKSEMEVTGKAEGEAEAKPTEGTAGHKPFACDQCERRFRMVKDLEKHKEVHEAVAGGAGYTCDTCGRQFKMKHALHQVTLSKESCLFSL